MYDFEIRKAIAGARLAGFVECARMWNSNNADKAQAELTRLKDSYKRAAAKCDEEEIRMENELNPYAK